MPNNDSDSKSSSSSSQTTTSEDNRVGAEGGGIALGKGSSVTISQSFGPEVAAAFNRLITLAEGAGKLVYDITQQSNSLSTKALDAGATAQKTTTDALSKITDQLDKTQKGGTTIFADLFPFIAAGIIAVVAIFGFGKKEK
jgi:hypothetical protein